ncbi:hypothetical protein [uncultured Shewanella sp.]|uniref:hypothetical protein n=1 Tax=uncultured Shewanella sp. TaxID=173975 RepID=UPI00262215AB|nr:hypothetical protein [uncultured Shewanella sp.]
MASELETCKKKEYLVEILGIKESDTQKVVITGQKPADEVIDTKNNSQLHVWQADGVRDKATLLIETEKGPVELPLFDSFWTSDRCQGSHDYVVAPIVPLVKLENNRTGVIHARDGFLYIFMGQKIWREILISFEDDCTPIYKDTLLTKLRAEDENADIPSEYDRPAIGQPMEAIYLPIKNYRSWGGLLESEKPQVFYSEVQLSAERLRVLEADKKQLSDHCERISFNLPSDHASFGRFYKLDKVAPQRARSKQSVGEMMYADPVAYLQDLSGDYAKGIADLAVEELTQLETDGPFGRFHSDSLRHQKTPEPGEISLGRYDMAPRLRALHLSKHRPVPDNAVIPNDDELWQSHGSESDIFEASRENQYVGLILSDPLFDLRHQIEQTTQGLTYLTELQEYIGRHEHFNLANFVHHVILAKHEPKLRQLYDDYGDKVSVKDNAPLTRIILPELRKVARDAIEQAQYMSNKLVNRDYGHAALLDLFTLNNEDYLAGHLLISRFADSLLYSAEGKDSFVKKANKSKYTRQIFWFLKALSNDHELTPMLYPAEGEVPADGVWDYQACLQQGPSENKGDGHCRIYELLTLAQGDQLSDKPLQTLDVIFAASVDNSFAEAEAKQVDTATGVLSGMKRFFNDLGGFMGGLAVAGQAYMTTLKGSNELIKSDAKVFVHTLELQKVLSAKAFADIHFISGDIPSGHVLVGASFQQQDFGITASSKQITTLNNVKVDGIGESSDNLAAANHKQTLKQNSSNSLKHPPRQHIAIFTAPADSDVAKMSQQQVIKDMHAAGRFEVGLQKIMPGLLILELWNLQAAVEGLQTDKTRRGRHIFSTVGATFDTLLTFEQVLGLINQKNVLTRSLSPRVIPTGKAWLEANTRSGSLFNRVAGRMVGRVAASYALGIVSGVITVGVYLADMANDIKQGDTDAAIANGIAAFCAATSTSALFLGMFSVGFAMPVFWVFLVLGGIAAGIAAWLDDDDIELLLINGPLGLEPNKARYGYLHQPNEAYYRLVSYLTQPQLTFSQLSDNELRHLTPLIQQHVPTNSAIADAGNVVNRKVSVTTQFPSWFRLNDFRVKVRLIKDIYHYRQKDSYFYKADQTEEASFDPYYQQTPQGLDIFVQKPNIITQDPSRFSGPKMFKYRLQLKLQLIARKSEQQAWVFPAPPIGTDGEFTLADRVVDFEQADQDFWLFEEWT